MEKKEKQIYFEVMRIVACFFVIFNHTGVDGYFLFSTREPGSPHFWIELFVSVFCKFAVPLFLAISGALLLTKEEEPIGVIYKKRISRILIVLLLSSLLYYYWTCVVIKGAAFSWKLYWINVYGSMFSTHLWYLYAYLAFLMSLPMLRAMVNHMETKHFYYMFGLALFFQGILPAIEYLANGFDFTLNDYARQGWLLVKVICFPCLGYFLEYHVKLDNPKKTLFWVWVVNVLLIGFTCYMTYRKIILTGDCNEFVSQQFHEYFVIVNCSAVYLTIKCLFKDRTLPKLVRNLIFSMASCSFGIYIIHIIARDMDEKIGFYQSMIGMGMEGLLAAFLFSLAIFLVCYAVIFVVKLIPGMKKLI